MRIGIMSYRQFPFISANTAIAYIVGEKISERHEVIFIGRKQDENQDSVKTYLNQKIVFLNEKAKSDSARTMHFLARFGLISLAYCDDALALNRIVKRESIDALICVTAPTDDVFIAMSARLQIPIYIYQLDPFYNAHDTVDEQMKRRFIRYLRKAEHLFTTELLMRSYKLDKTIEPYLQKISVIQFPKLIKPKAGNQEKKYGLRLLYSGTLYAGRKPEHLIDLKKCLPEACEIVFCGKCEKKEDEQNLLRNGILYKGYCSQETLAAEFDAADILINIGNLVKNQLPSKVVDYIATGKPIINLFQIEECTSRQALKGYRYCLDVDVHSIMQNKDLITKFVLQYGNKRIPWNDLQKQYREYTPEFVSECILQEIEKICGRR